MIYSCSYGYEDRKMTFNIFKGPLFVPASDWSVRRFRMLLISKDNLEYHGNIGRLIIVVQKILKENKKQMWENFLKKSFLDREESWVNQVVPSKSLKTTAVCYVSTSLYANHHLSILLCFHLIPGQFKKQVISYLLYRWGDWWCSEK